MPRILSSSLLRFMKNDPADIRARKYDRINGGSVSMFLSVTAAHVVSVVYVGWNCCRLHICVRLRRGGGLFRWMALSFSFPPSTPFLLGLFAYLPEPFS